MVAYRQKKRTPGANPCAVCARVKFDFQIPRHGSAREEEKGRGMSSPGRSPPPEAESTEKSVTQAPVVTTLALVMADGTSRSEDLATVVTVVAGGGGSEEFGGPAKGSCFSRTKDNGFGVVPGRLVRLAVMRLAFGLRVSAAMMCLVSFSVMAADNTPGWAGDFFGRYREYWYLVAINAIAFVYSTFQAYTKVHHLIFKKFIIVPPINFFFDFSVDQVLAYLLLSASSIAASRNDIWVSRFGSDEFIDMANGSIAISFLAFLALALSSLISAYNFFRWSSGVML